jgi:hypothetical protein
LVRLGVEDHCLGDSNEVEGLTIFIVIDFNIFLVEPSEPDLHGMRDSRGWGIWLVFF